MTIIKEMKLFYVLNIYQLRRCILCPFSFPTFERPLKFIKKLSTSERQYLSKTSTPCAANWTADHNERPSPSLSFSFELVATTIAG